MPTSLTSSVFTRRSSVCRRHDWSDLRSRPLASSGMVPFPSRGSATCRGVDKSLVTLRELWKDLRDSTREARISGSLFRTNRAQPPLYEFNSSPETLTCLQRESRDQFGERAKRKPPSISESRELSLRTTRTITVLSILGCASLWRDHLVLCVSVPSRWGTKTSRT